MDKLSHVDEEGRAAMVDVGAKQASARRAVASARVLMSKETVEAVRAHRTPKGDPLEVARLAGIMAAKRTADLIPLCHPLALTHVEVRAELATTASASKRRPRPPRRPASRWKRSPPPPSPRSPSTTCARRLRKA